MNREISSLAENISSLLLDENGDINKDELLECLLRAFDAGRRSVLNIASPDIAHTEIHRVRELAGMPKKDV